MSTAEQHDATDEDTTTSDEFDSEAFARQIADYLWDRKALNTVIIDLRGRVSYTDFIVLCTGTSERHIQAIGRYLDDEMRELGYRPLGREGLDGGSWGLLDYGDAIVHIFDDESRSSFDIEGMWTDAPRLDLSDEQPAELYGHFALQQFEDA